MKIWRHIASTTILALGLIGVPSALAGTPVRNGRVTKPISERQLLHTRLSSVKRAYRLGEIGRKSAWEQLSWLHERGQKLSREDRILLLQTQAVMLAEASFPVLAAIYASQALKIAPDPAAPIMETSWAVLRRSSQAKAIQSVLEVVADEVNLKGKAAPVFGTEWWYYAGNAVSRHGKRDLALKLYGNLDMGDRYFFPAKYQQGLQLIEAGDFKKAEAMLKAILNPIAHDKSPLAEKERAALVDYAHLALGRMYYEKERFAESAKMYRAVSRNGTNFYDSLFEQAWAFFLAGYPTHALGALHAVESPFYANVFNPEAPILRALVHYWLCRYEDSRNALADFSEKYAPAVEKLEEFLDRRRLDSEVAYQLFEDMVSGVSESALAMPRSILQTAAEKDAMLLVRDQYATILEEKTRLETVGIFGWKTSNAKPLEYLDRWAGALRKDVGKRFLTELQDMRKDFERLYSQAQFLYVELLMSEKDQLLGRELHADAKITQINRKVKVSGWADKTQAWRDAKYGEYWWDEVGWYIAPVEPMCQVSNAPSQGVSSSGGKP